MEKQQDERLILGVEIGPVEAGKLERTLRELAQPIRVVDSAAAAIRLVRCHLFYRAVVAAELAIEGRSLLDYLLRLPAMESVVAIGPAGNVGVEIKARLAGAGAYLPRPVTSHMLARALGLQVSQEVRGPPRTSGHAAQEPSERR